MKALAILPVLALLAGCGGSQPPVGASGAMAQSSAVATRPDRGKSWMLPEAKNEDLLYVSNATGPTVSVYRYWQRELVGVLTGFSEPLGECVDASHDIYVTDYGAEKLFEFAHGGKSPVSVINDAPYHPSGCAIDLKRGDLAVANYGETLSSQGSVVIYAHARGKPRIYNGPLLDYASCAYDNEGNLLTTDGNDSNEGSGGSHFAWLAKANRELLPITLHGGSSFGAFNYVHGIAWDGRFWAINAFEINQISRVRIARHGGHLAGTTYIGGPAGQMGPVAIYNNSLGSQGTQAVGTVGWSYPEVFYWKYPSGGQPIAEITTGLDRPLGIAISLK